MIRHIVLFGKRPDVSDDQIDALIDSLRALEGIIPEIRFYEVVRDEIGAERSATFGVFSHFDDYDALQRYRDHPDHQNVLATIRELTEWSKAWDFTIPANHS
jgi:NAD-dependent DNA ligase